MSTRPRGSLSVLGAVGLSALALLTAGTLGLIPVGIAMATRNLAFAPAAAAVARDPLLLAVCQLGGLLTAAGVGALRIAGHESSFRDALDLRPVPTAVIALALSAGLALQFPLREVQNLLTELAPGLAFDQASRQALQQMVHIDSLRDAWVIPLALVAIPAFSEEVFFRGVLLPGMEARHGPRVALLCSALLFGVIHGTPVAMLPATVAGLLLGLVRLRTGSVLPCIAMHGAFNAAPILLPAELVRIEGFNIVGERVYHLPMPLVVGGAVVCALCLAVLTRLTSDADEP